MDERTAEGNALTPNFVPKLPLPEIPAAKAAICHWLWRLGFREIESPYYRYRPVYHVFVQTDERVGREYVVMFDKEEPFETVLDRVLED